MKVLFYIILMVLFCGCSLSAKFSKKPTSVIEYVDMNGTVLLYFKHIDGWYYGSKMVFIDKNTQEQCFFEQDICSMWSNLCCPSAKNYFSKYDLKGGNLFYGYRQYEDTTSTLYQGEGNGYYHGNAIYFCNEDMDIAVAFNITGKGFLIKKACKSFMSDMRAGYNDAPDCPFVISRKDLFGLPFVSLAKLDTLYSLSPAEQLQMGLVPVLENKFYIGICE